MEYLGDFTEALRGALRDLVSPGSPPSKLDQVSEVQSESIRLPEPLRCWVSQQGPDSGRRKADLELPTSGARLFRRSFHSGWKRIET